MEQKKRKKIKKKQRTAGQNFLMFVLNFVAMLGAVFLIGYIALSLIDGWTQHGEAVKVPQIKGKTLSDATTMLEQNDLKCEVIDSIYVKDELPGRILELTPEENTEVKRGRKIYVTLNTNNIPLRVVPDVAENSSQRQAEAKLLAAGFKLLPPQLVKGESEWVYGVIYKGDTLKAGQKAPIGSTLMLLVGNGTSRPIKVTINDSVTVFLDSLSVSQDSLNRAQSLEDREAAKRKAEQEKDDSWFE
jgi:beta-lactam-binding protein with PASTA domain